MRVSQLVRVPAVSCEANTSIREVGQLMDRHNVGSIVVTDAGHVTGIVTDRDIVLRAVARGCAADAPVATVMTGDVAKVFVRADINEAAATMRARGVRRLPVVDAHGRLMGVVALDDVVRSMGLQADEVSDLLLLQLSGHNGTARTPRRPTDIRSITCRNQSARGRRKATTGDGSPLTRAQVDEGEHEARRAPPRRPGSRA